MDARVHSADADANQNLNQNVINVNQFYNNLGGQLRYFLNVVGTPLVSIYYEKVGLSCLIS